MKSVVCVILILMLAISLNSCLQLFDAGTATIPKTVYNPSHTKQAILFQKGGNATEADSYQVSINDADDTIDKTEVGNIFTADDNHGAAYLSATSITLHWKSSSELLIIYDKKLRTFKRLTLFEHIQIAYEMR